MARGRRFTDSICASVILILVWYIRVQNHALTRSPVVVVVPRMQLGKVSVERSGWAAQLMLMVLKSWCSTGFHLEAVCPATSFFRSGSTVASFFRWADAHRPAGGCGPVYLVTQRGGLGGRR
jgi:hypothetical protein